MGKCLLDLPDLLVTFGYLGTLKAAPVARVSKTVRSKLLQVLC